jgi:hypothetical protein
MPDMEVVAQKLVIVSQDANDFSGTCNYFLAQVSHLHGGSQLENSKYTKNVMCPLVGRMSLSKKFPHQSRLFHPKRYNFIQSPIDLHLIIKFNLSLLI